MAPPGEKIMNDTYAIMTHRMLQIGDQFDRFQIQGHLAQGGMSEIYRAFDLVNRVEVALKLPEAALIGDPAQYERFQREIEVVRTLDHPAVLKGLDAGRFNRIPFLVTEFIQGDSLRKIIETRAPLPLDFSLALVRKVAEGMAYCHDNGVVHRDLKPENILVTPEGQPVIMDFGLALTKSAHRVTYSNLSATMGTPDYMAPEQIEGQRGDARTDIYALGTILFEMLAGRVPFSGDSQLAVMAQHVQSAAPRLDRLCPAVPPTVAAIAARCLKNDPDQRYADMRALIEALDHPEAADLNLLEDARDTTAPDAAKWLKSSAVRAAALGLGLLVVLVLLAYVLQTLRR
jgi:eukaryotic-like serine/threonine-protein kinase